MSEETSHGRGIERAWHGPLEAWTRGEGSELRGVFGVKYMRIDMQSIACVRMIFIDMFNKNNKSDLPFIYLGRSEFNKERVFLLGVKGGMSVGVVAYLITESSSQKQSIKVIAFLMLSAVSTHSA